MKYKLKSTTLIVALVFVAGTLFVNGSNVQGKNYKLGYGSPAGGWVFYDKGRYSDGWRYLEAAPEDQSTNAKWGCYGTSIPGAKGTAIGTGKSNTQAIVKNCREANIAAKVCTNYRGGGKSDWFLPSKDELNLMYTNLKEKGVGGFANKVYWSSSEIGAGGAWDQYFDDRSQEGGSQDGGSKDNDYRLVRAIRAF